MADLGRHTPNQETIEEVSRRYNVPGELAAKIVRRRAEWYAAEETAKKKDDK